MKNNFKPGDVVNVINNKDSPECSKIPINALAIVERVFRDNVDGKTLVEIAHVNNLYDFTVYTVLEDDLEKSKITYDTVFI